jgi:hypothetical protein
MIFLLKQRYFEGLWNPPLHVGSRKNDVGWGSHVVKRYRLADFHKGPAKGLPETLFPPVSPCLLLCYPYGHTHLHILFLFLESTCGKRGRC